MKKSLSLILALVMVISLMPMNALATEPSHVHSYTTEVTAPTCTEQGYTTYTCACGDSFVDDYVDAVGHSYENGICTVCGAVVDDWVWQVIRSGEVFGAFVDLQSAVDSCGDGDTVKLTADCAAVYGAVIEKNITIDGGSHLLDISGCSDAFITVTAGTEVTIKNLSLDGGADGFEVDYDSVTYTNFTIPLKSGSLDNDPKASQSAIISSGTLICENVDISNRYTSSYGGAMRILEGSLTLLGCDFTHNYGTTYGGALYIGSNFGDRTEYPVTQVSMTNCTFTDNYTGHGGAIYVYNTAQLQLTGCDFTGNTANGGKGGAIDIAVQNTTAPVSEVLGLDYVQTYIDGCTFDGNWAGNDGFAIQYYDSELYVTDTVFSNNVGVHPTSSVGTVSLECYRYLSNDWPLDTLLDGCTFEGNIGPASCYGDHNSPNAYLNVTDCVFRENLGNDMMLLYSSVANISKTEFVDNQAAYGVIDARKYENYMVPALLTLTDVTFEGTVGGTDILVRKQNHNMELETYNIVLNGTTVGNIDIWDRNAVQINGSHTGSVDLDSVTDLENLTINGTHSGQVEEHPDTYTVILLYPYTNGFNTGEFLYLPRGEAVVGYEIFPHRDGYVLSAYTNSACTSAWDMNVSGHLTIYGAWVEHDSHSYVNGVCEYCGDVQYAIHLGGMSLNLESEIHYNLDFTLEGFDMENVEEIGLLKFYTKTEDKADSTYETADEVTVGYEIVDGYYRVRSNGIPAKNMGDDGWYRMYVKLSDGTIVYSLRYKYSAKIYADTVLNGDYSDELKALCVSLMNYGAAAQVYFAETSDYTYETLMNAHLTEAQQALVSNYSADMIDERLSVTDGKSGEFVLDRSVFENGYSSYLTLLGAITMNIEVPYTAPSATESGLLIWSQEDYLAAETLTWENATLIETCDADGQIELGYTGIAAKNMGDTVFACAYVLVDGEYHYTGIFRISVDYYASKVIGNDDYAKSMQSLSEYMVVYGEYAKTYFANQVTE